MLAHTLPARRTVKGMRLVWRHAPLVSDDPVVVWQGVLEARGLDERDSFFAPRLADLPDPFAMRDMDVAASRVAEAVRAGEPIHVFGDFDCDGVCGTAILVEALHAAGGRVSCSIPHRADDGHGIGVSAVEQAHASGARLGISVDTGTTCFEACARARALGLDMIVSDHHLPEASLPPALAVLNPARADCGFAERRLCGTGVAFFLLMAAWRRLAGLGQRPAFDLRRLLDRVAVATVADVMDLLGVNRILVHHGLAQLNRTPSVGLRALLAVSRVRQPVDAEAIAFHLAPRINAAGRLAHGEQAMRLLATQDGAEAEQLAAELDQANRLRRRIEQETFKEAERKLGDDSVLAVYDRAWHAGVVGLVAGRLARKHGRPAAVGFVDGDGQHIRLSLRGRPGFHIGALLRACATHLRGFGGHAGAGGGTVAIESWPAFRAAFAEAVAEQAARVRDHLQLPVDGMLGLAALHHGLAVRLARFAPFGAGNRPCTWLLPEVQVVARKDLRGGVTRLVLGDGVRQVRAVSFQDASVRDHLLPGRKVSVLGSLQVDDWQGHARVQFVIEDLLGGEDAHGAG
ncbi:MAG: single-stranded-DNA-specific exonuclease RecJ [Zetaproteobacteria bacterium]|nr:MAG: single-stranded-DNA-specific exonuclease RecJ [Zetaproteobacteria bacterium]